MLNGTIKIALESGYLKKEVDQSTVLQRCSTTTLRNHVEKQRFGRMVLVVPSTKPESPPDLIIYRDITPGPQGQWDV